MNPSDEFLVKFSNLWFYQDNPIKEMSDSMKHWMFDMVRMLLYGDDAIFSHPKINEIILLCKDYGLIDYDKSIMSIYYEGKMRVQIELRQAFNSPQVSMAFQALTNVLGEFIEKIKSEAEKQIKKAENAVPYLSNKKPFQN
jgi:hypothetical protein